MLKHQLTKFIINESWALLFKSDWLSQLMPLLVDHLFKDFVGHSIVNLWKLGAWPVIRAVNLRSIPQAFNYWHSIWVGSLDWTRWWELGQTVLASSTILTAGVVDAGLERALRNNFLISCRLHLFTASWPGSSLLKQDSAGLIRCSSLWHFPFSDQFWFERTVFGLKNFFFFHALLGCLSNFVAVKESLVHYFSIGGCPLITVILRCYFDGLRLLFCFCLFVA